MARISRISGNCALAAGLLAGASVLAPPFQAQNPTLAVTRVSTVPDAIWFHVDGQAYLGPQTFNWPTGSKHVLSADAAQEMRAGVRHTFQQWEAGSTVGGSTALAQGASATVTADPALPSFQAVFQVEYGLTINHFSCDAEIGIPCKGPGTVYAAGTPITKTTTVWTSKNSVIALEAAPNPGYVFAGWATSNNQVIQGFLNRVTLTGPMTVTPVFQVARRIELNTEPSGLSLSIDRTPIATPHALDWGRGSVHTVTALSPQRNPANGSLWIFSSWSDGGAVTHAYNVSDEAADALITAVYVPAMQAAIYTNPASLRLKIDGRESAPPYSFIWGGSEKHRVEAPERQTDGQGRTWVFEGWSDGLPAAHEIQTPGESLELGFRLEAKYRQLGRVTVGSNLAVKVAVDGVECATPCTVERELGTTVRVAAPASLRLGDDVRADFDRWSDGSQGNGSVTATAEPRTLTATYRTLNRLRISADPAEAAVCRLAPESPDGFYENGSVVTVSMSARTGFRFRRWEGDLTGVEPGAAVLMNSPRAARAAFDRVPYIAPAGVRNAAGATGTEGVAPGSVIAVSGSHLAGDTLAGPENPLLQALGDVTVRLGDRLLPLFYVSPERITAQLPQDLEEGESTLAVRWANQAEVRAQFTVTRNAPGLFENFSDERAWGVAMHADGKLVSAAAPLRTGETVTLLGSGFGPTEPTRPLGFAVPPEPVFRLLDAVTVKIADRAAEVGSAQAAPGRTGVDGVTFRVPADLPAGTPAAVSVEVGGRASNVVYLPVE